MISRLQAQLEAIYEIHCEHRAESFVVDAPTAMQLGGTGRAPEELLVDDSSGELELALYLDPELLARLKPFEQISEEVPASELNGYCQLAEGVSHFLYIAHTAAEHRRVSLLELEAQAEVDKFALCLLQRWGDGALTWARELIERLFERVSYNPLLSVAERWRYEEANRLSRNYCLRLIPLIASRHRDRLLAALRYSYRLGAEAKLRHLAALVR